MTIITFACRNLKSYNKGNNHGTIVGHTARVASLDKKF